MATLSKLIIKKITISLSLVILFLFSNASKATPPDYLSEYCFIIQFNPKFENSSEVLMRMGVTNQGDNYFLGTGTIAYDSSLLSRSTGPLIFTGTIIPTGNEYQMSANGTKYDTTIAPFPLLFSPRIVIQNIHMIIDSTTLDGTVRIKETVINNGVTQPDSPDSYTTGTVSFSQSCSLS
jgi:hypothetical protein